MDFKFICPSCQLKVNSAKQSIGGIEYCVCPVCNNTYSLDDVHVLNRETNEYFGKVSIEGQMYEPTKIDKDGQDYDMQPRSKR